MEKTSKIYIAGHNGLVGSSLVKRLETEGYTNLILRNRLELDLLDQNAVMEFFLQEKPEYVILAAAKVGGAEVNKKFPFEMLFENLQIQSNIINASYVTGVQRLVFIASSTVYPVECQQPITENSIFTGSLDALHESYGLAKIVGMKLCEKIRNQMGRDFFTLAPTNIYGVGDHFEETRAHVIGALMTRFHKAKLENFSEVSVWGSGNALREFLYVDDFVDALLFFLKNPPKESLVNIGIEQEVSIADLADMIAVAVGYKGKIIFDTTKPEGRLRRKLDTQLAESYGWSATTSLSQGLQKTYDYFLTTL